MKLRKISSKSSHPILRKTPSNSQQKDLKTSDIFRFEEKNKRVNEDKIYEDFQRILKTLILFNFKVGYEGRGEDLIEHDLRMLIFNEDLIFDRNYENQEFLCAFIYVLWQIIIRYIYSISVFS